MSGKTYSMKSGTTYLTTIYDSTKPAGSQCDLTSTGTTNKTEATPFKFTKKGTEWIISVDCDKDGKWTSFLSENPTDLIQIKEKNASKVKRQRWVITCKTKKNCSLKNVATSKYLAPSGTSDTQTFWTLEKAKAPKAPNASNASNAASRGAPISNGDWQKTNISYYGQSAADDNGEGFIGVNLFKLGQSGLQFNGKKVYPVAVHHDHAPTYLYKVLEVRGDKVTPGFLGYVSDICNRKDSSCKNAYKNGLKFLVDIHKTGFEASGNKNNGNDFTTGEFRVVGQIPPTEIPKTAWLDGDKTYVMCKCTGQCEGKEQIWKSVKELSSC